VYEDRHQEPRERWVQVAEENPRTGAIEWVHDWHRRVTGWIPLAEYLRERGRW
jgi:hypothetical protein